MAMLVIAAGSALGYFLNRNGKQNRMPAQKTVVAANDIPSGPNIYQSERTKQVDSQIRGVAKIKYAQAMKQNFPLDYDRPQTVFPQDDLYNIGAQLIELNANDLPPSGQLPVNATPYDPQTGKPIKRVVDIPNAPMFREFKGATTAGYSELSPNVSLLSGQPTDYVHGNMNPRGNFGTVSEANSQVLLERFTGISSTLDQGTYREKREVVRPPPNNPDILRKPDVTVLKDLHSRVSVKPSHEYSTPVKSFKDLPLTESQVRILPRNLDEVNGSNSKQKTYSLPTVSGQRGQTRGMLPNLSYNRPTLFTEYQADSWTPSRTVSGRAAVIQTMPQVRDILTTEVHQNKYHAPPQAQMKSRGNLQTLNAQMATMGDTVSNKMDVWTPEYGAPIGQQRARISTATLMVKEPKNKDNRQDYVSAPYQGNVGTVPRNNIKAPEMTVRETVQGPTMVMNAEGRKMNTAYQKTNVDLQMTSKAAMSENTWTGLPHQDLGMGNRNQKYELPTTMKDTTLTSGQMGAARSKIPAHISYDSVFTEGFDRSQDNRYTGIASGQKKDMNRDAEVEGGYKEDLLAEDYFGNPLAPMRSRQINRDDVTLKDHEVLEFGGYAHNPNKFAGGDYSGRDSQMRLKEDNTVEGRLNVGMHRDGEVMEREVDVTLKEEHETPMRPAITRTQPKESLDNIGVGIQIRTKNTEALNPRLDTGVKITSDLFPFVN